MSTARFRNSSQEGTSPLGSGSGLCCGGIATRFLLDEQNAMAAVASWGHHGCSSRPSVVPIRLWSAGQLLLPCRHCCLPSLLSTPVSGNLLRSVFSDLFLLRTLRGVWRI